MRKLIFVLVMALSTTVYGSRAKEIKYQSSADQSEQLAMFYAPLSKEPAPLMVALHTWSGNYKQKYHKAIEQWCIKHGWAYIHPDFRGPNNRPEATGSKLVVADIVSAVEYAKKSTQIDHSAIYLVGTSGDTEHIILRYGPRFLPGCQFRTWRPGTHRESMSKHWNSHAAEPPVDTEYAKRSPITFLSNAKGNTLHLHAGIKEKIVPISHSLLAFNELAAAKDRIPKEDITYFVKKRKVPPNLQAAPPDPSYGKNQPLFTRKSGNATVTIFDGGHHLVATAATAWIEQVYKEKKN